MCEGWRYRRKFVRLYTSSVKSEWFLQWVTRDDYRSSQHLSHWHVHPHFQLDCDGWCPSRSSFWCIRLIYSWMTASSWATPSTRVPFEDVAFCFWLLGRCWTSLPLLNSLVSLRLISCAKRSIDCSIKLMYSVVNFYHYNIWQHHPHHVGRMYSYNGLPERGMGSGSWGNFAGFYLTTIP